jgi:very-short-patch-repair endonuclease
MLPDPIDRSSLFEVAKRQLGLVTLKQANAAGISAPTISRLVRSGEWVRLFPGVYALPGSTPSWRRDLKAATLWAGPKMAVSHRSAARLLGIGNFAGGLIELSGPRNLRSRDPRVVCHVVRDLRPDDVIFIDGIPVTNATITLIQLASVVDEAMEEDALVEAVSRRLTTLSRLRFELRRPWHGKSGIATLRRIVDEAQAYGLAETIFENRLLRALKQGGIDPPARQFKVWDGKKILARIDVAYPKEMLAIEADSFRFHSNRSSWSRDRVKHNALTIRGWMIIRVTWDDLRTRPAEVAKEIGRALAMQRKRFGLDRSLNE